MLLLYKIPTEYLLLVELQLKKLFNHFNSENYDKDQLLTKRLAGPQADIKELTLRWGLNKIDKDTYEVALEHLNKSILEINRELNYVKPEISNLEKLILQSVENVHNLSKIWASSDLEGKRLLQKTLFPEGVLYNSKKHEYLTTNTNKFIELIGSISNSCEGNKKGNLQNIIENSLSVARWRIELQTSGL